jgi:ABC-2 type transport system permease protein
MQTFDQTLAVSQRILTELWRRKRSLIFWMVFPVTILVINGLILEERAQLSMGDAFAQAAPSSLVGAALFFSCLGGSVATVVSEREQQTLKRLFVSPLTGLSYFLGILLAHVCIGLGQTGLVLTTALILGAKFSGSPLLAALIIGLSIVNYVGLGFALGAQFARRTEDVNALVATFGVPLLLLGGTFLPVSLFPSSLLQLAHYNLIYHMNEALSRVLNRGDGIGAIAPHLTVLVGFGMFLMGAGWFFYQRMVQVERQF